MIILLEGVDGSGKTTLCNELKKRGFDVEVPVDRLEKSPFTKWLNLARRDTICVVDRSFITELVYRTVDGKPTGKMLLSSMCSILNHCKIVLCETESAFEDSIRRGEDNITDRATSKKISHAYNVIIPMLSKFNPVKTFTYNWKRQTVDDVVDFILEGEIANY